MDKIAIIGSGIAGLGCAHFLHGSHQLTIFEADAHVGGHSNTITIDEEDGAEVALDTGFMVYNEVTYPLLTRLFRELEVPTKPTSMSFSVHHSGAGVEWNGSGLNTLFGQRRNLLRPRHWRFLLQLNRFNREAVPALSDPRWEGVSLVEYVDERGYGEDFLHHYLIPMSGAVWSAAPEHVLRFPALTLLRFWHNHGFLGMDTQHPWRTVEGGSREYVTRLTAPFRDSIFTDTPVRSVRVIEGGKGGAEVESPRGTEHFDRVVFATHADQALRLLRDPSPLQSELLAPFAYSTNDVRVHSDPDVMPDRQRCWASWNYRSDSGGNTIHYWMNSLQGVSKARDYFVSLNASDRIPAEATHLAMEYEHPLFDLGAIEAQARLPELNAPTDPLFFCGSYFSNGFHEDAFRSAVDLCTLLLGDDPWEMAS